MESSPTRATGKLIFVLADRARYSIIDKELSVINVLLGYSERQVRHVHLFISFPATNLTNLSNSNRLSIHSIPSTAPDSRNRILSTLKLKRSNPKHLSLLRYIVNKDNNIPKPTLILTTQANLLTAITLSDIHDLIPVHVLSESIHTSIRQLPNPSHSETTAIQAAYTIFQTVSSNSTRTISTHHEDRHWNSVTHVSVCRELLLGDCLSDVNKWRLSCGLEALTEVNVVDCFLGGPPVVNVFLNFPFRLIGDIDTSGNSNVLCTQPLLLGSNVHDDDYVDDEVLKCVENMKENRDKKDKTVLIITNNTTISPKFARRNMQSSAASVNYIILNPTTSTRKRRQPKHKKHIFYINVQPSSTMRTIRKLIPYVHVLVCDAEYDILMLALYHGIPTATLPSTPLQTFWANSLQFHSLSTIVYDFHSLFREYTALKQRCNAFAASFNQYVGYVEDGIEVVAGSSSNSTSRSSRRRRRGRRRRGVLLGDVGNQNGADVVARLIVSDDTYDI